MKSNAEADIPFSRLWQVAGEAMAAMYRDAPGLESTQSSEFWTVISGEPGSLFNWLVIHTPHADNEARLRAGVATCRARQVAALVLIVESLATELAPVASELGLESFQPLPLMLLSPNRPMTRPVPPGITVERVENDHGLRISTGIAAAAFEESAISFARCCGPSLLTSPATSLYLARAGSDALSMCWIWRDGPLAYVAAMATSPGHQRRGAGRAVLNHALAEHAASGATTAFLLASDDGRPLYEQVGFRIVDTAPLWVVP